MLCSRLVCCCSSARSWPASIYSVCTILAARVPASKTSLDLTTLPKRIPSHSGPHLRFRTNRLFYRSGGVPRVPPGHVRGRPSRSRRRLPRGGNHLRPYGDLHHQRPCRVRVALQLCAHVPRPRAQAGAFRVLRDCRHAGVINTGYTLHRGWLRDTRLHPLRLVYPTGPVISLVCVVCFARRAAISSIPIRVRFCQGR